MATDPRKRHWDTKWLQSQLHYTYNRSSSLQSIMIHSQHYNRTIKHTFVLSIDYILLKTPLETSHTHLPQFLTLIASKVMNHPIMVVCSNTRIFKC